MNARLSPREKDILNLVLGGCSNPEIADKLNMSVKTVSTRICRIYLKFGLTGQKSPRKLLRNMCNN